MATPEGADWVPGPSAKGTSRIEPIRKSGRLQQPTIDLQFVVSTGSTSNSVQVQKLIRRHVMLGRNRQAQKPSPSEPGICEPCRLTESDNELWQPKIPAKIGTDLALTPLASDLEPSTVSLLMKCWLALAINHSPYFWLSTSWCSFWYGKDDFVSSRAMHSLQQERHAVARANVLRCRVPQRDGFCNHELCRFAVRP